MTHGADCGRGGPSAVRPAPKSILIAGALTGLAVGVGACGVATRTVTDTTGSRSATATTGSASTASALPTKAQFIAQANRICRLDNAQLKPILARVGALKGSTLATESKALPPLILQAVAIERADIARLQALPKPAGEAAEVIEKLVVADQEKETDATNLAHALANEELSAIDAAEETAKTAKARVHGLAQGYGIECGGETE